MREKDSYKSKNDILAAAEQIFSEKGLYGTRVDEIAAKADINKRMIYEYFGGKTELYKRVLEIAYTRIGNMGQALLTGYMPVGEAVRRVVRFYFNYLNSHPAYVNLIIWENLNRGVYMEDLDVSRIQQPALNALKSILERGKKEGVVAKRIDAEKIIITLLTSTFAYFSNRHTLSKLLQADIMRYESMEAQAEELAEMILSYIAEEKGGTL